MANNMTLRISALMALIASFSAAYAAIAMSRIYSELLQGAALPRLTQTVTWHNGLFYWAIMPITLIILYIIGERTKSDQRKQRIAETIMIIGTISTIAFMIGSILPLTRITVSLE